MRYASIAIFLIIMNGLIAQEQTVGLFVNEEASSNGYTLFTNSRTTHLIDNCGFQVNTWESAFTPGLGVYLLPNGNLLRAGRVSGVFNGGGVGGQFELFSWEGNTLWSYRFADETRHSHHDLEPLPNGNFLALAWTLMTAEEALASGREFDEEVWIEKIFEIKIVGSGDIEIVWEWSLADHLVQDAFPDKPNFGMIRENPGKMNFNYIPADQGLERDWAHFNAIAYNERLDQIAVSSRNFSEIWILDHSTTTAEASTSSGGNSGKGGDILYRYGNPQVYDRGNSNDQVFFNQHNIEWIRDDFPNGGSLSVFNNRWQNDRSRVERWTPPMDGDDYILEQGRAFGPEELDWSYAGDFYSMRISGVQFMENGNALIRSGTRGQFLEVTEDENLVWEYINPMRSTLGPIAQGDEPFQNSTFRILRYRPDYEAFIGRDLTPGDPIELDPFVSDCLITDIEEVNTELNDDIKLYQNIVQERVEIGMKKSTSAKILNTNGVQMGNENLQKGQNYINVSSYPTGMYFLVIDGQVLKFMKI